VANSSGSASRPLLVEVTESPHAVVLPRSFQDFRFPGRQFVPDPLENAIPRSPAEFTELSADRNHRLDAELRVELLLPLLQECLRSDDQNALDASPLQQLARHEPGSDGLPEPHIVGDETTGSKPTKEQDRVVDLVSERLHRRRRQRQEVLPPVDVEGGAQRPLHRRQVKLVIARIPSRLSTTCGQPASPVGKLDVDPIKAHRRVLSRRPCLSSQGSCGFGLGVDDRKGLDLQIHPVTEERVGYS
jgi:hypothetical protein